MAPVTGKLEKKILEIFIDGAREKVYEVLGTEGKYQVRVKTNEGIRIWTPRYLMAMYKISNKGKKVTARIYQS